MGQFRYQLQTFCLLGIGLFVAPPLVARVRRRKLTMIPPYMKFVAVPTWHYQVGVIGATVAHGLHPFSIRYATTIKILMRQKVYAFNMVEGSVRRLSFKLNALLGRDVGTM